jgi:uncharacterized protein DUF6152
MTRRTAGFLVLAGLVLLAAVSPSAHHGAASFDTSKQVTLKGTVTEWIWANPHCFLKIDAMDDTGSVRNWALEAQNPTSMTQHGWTRNSFKIGDQVTVVLEAVKNGAPIGRIVRITLPNGSSLEGVNAPPIPASVP